jgi:ATP synthase protein I
MLGLIGWSVCLPTLLGAWLGQWLDKQHPSTHAWTLTLLIAGLCLGCANAAHWISREQGAIQHGLEDEQ